MEKHVIKKIANWCKEEWLMFGAEFIVAITLIGISICWIVVDVILLIQGNMPTERHPLFLPELGPLGFSLLLFTRFKYEKLKLIRISTKKYSPENELSVAQFD